MAATSAICRRRDRLLVIRSLDQQREKILGFAKTYVNVLVKINLHLRKYLVIFIIFDKDHFQIGIGFCQ